MNPWLAASLCLLGVWLIIFAVRPKLRKEMLTMSFLTMPLGFTEPIFVPEYWNPPSLFNLATNTGFDIESLIFSFAFGGIAAVLYEAVMNVKHQRVYDRGVFHVFSITLPAVVFLGLYLFSSLNPIYSVIISGFVGSFVVMACRKDLIVPTVFGGLIFLTLYTLGFLIILFVYPGFSSYWNVSALSGVFVFGIPLEELLFAFSMGMVWSTLYEHAMRLRIIM